MTAPVITQPEVAAPAVTATTIAYDFTLLFAALRASIVQQLFAVWYGLADYSGKAVDEWLDTVLPMINAAEETSSSATATYLELQMELAGIDDFRAVPDFALTTGKILRGVDPSEVYSRPMEEVWTQLSHGVSFDEAVNRGANRLRQLVETDVQLSHTHTSRTLLSDRKDVVGFRRVPTGDYTCALCLIASTQRYRKFDLMPIHPGCDCRVAPIISDQPVDQVVDPDLLEDIHRRVEEMFGFSDRSGRKVDFRKLVVVHNHGEYGPTLSKAGDRFTVI